MDSLLHPVRPPSYEAPSSSSMLESAIVTNQVFCETNAIFILKFIFSLTWFVTIAVPLHSFACLPGRRISIVRPPTPLGPLPTRSVVGPINSVIFLGTTRKDVLPYSLPCCLSCRESFLLLHGSYDAPSCYRGSSAGPGVNFKLPFSSQPSTFLPPALPQRYL